MPRSKRTNQAVDTLYLGIDEAGYGPNLGPLVVTGTAFVGPNSIANEDWWSVLEGFIGRANTAHSLIVDDSKRILGITRGIAHLTSTVHTFLECTGCNELDLDDLHAYLDLDGPSSLSQEHWFDPNESCSELFTQSSTAGDLLTRMQQSHGVSLTRIRCRVMYPREFNQSLERLENKANIEQEIVGNLVRHLIEGLEPQIESVVVWVDRLGGRRYYQALVEDIAAGAFVAVLEESSKRSVYRFRSDGREVQVTFRVNGDALYLPVALASMVSKYLRERSMARFNAYWSRCLPGLVPTAGYPGDSRRFLQKIRSHLQPAGIAMDSLWRRK